MSSSLTHSHTHTHSAEPSARVLSVSRFTGARWSSLNERAVYTLSTVLPSVARQAGLVLPARPKNRRRRRIYWEAGRRGGLGGRVETLVLFSTGCVRLELPVLKSALNCHPSLLCTPPCFSLRRFAGTCLLLMCLLDE